ncbi:hypothetical protein CTAYLR_008447 [Chrysophaeum taylorii]|uniref:DOMON domain-containing protein n=1 Tax=Chrysophaeum taylorii TaxID=2483200 RepID=A0AAD7UKP3_9STRA|nr:hypothetical protein CTAYLR_008447 [Chrysophaeum taylorii]
MLLALLPSVRSHGFQDWPVGRNVYMWQEGYRHYCPTCLYVDKVYPEVETGGRPWYGKHPAADPDLVPWEDRVTNEAHATSFGVCGTKDSDKNYNFGFQYPSTATLTAGKTYDMRWCATADHGGVFAYRLCRNQTLVDKLLGDVPPTVAELKDLEKCYEEGELRCDDVEENDCTRGPRCQEGWGCDEPGRFHHCLGGYGRDFGCANSNEACTMGQVSEVKVKIPDDFPSGKTVMQWVWWCSSTPQVWAACMDVDVDGGTTRAPTASPAPTTVNPIAAPTLPKPTAGSTLEPTIREEEEEEETIIAAPTVSPTPCETRDVSDDPDFEYVVSPDANWRLYWTLEEEGGDPDFYPAIRAKIVKSGDGWAALGISLDDKMPDSNAIIAAGGAVPTNYDILPFTYAGPQQADAQTLVDVSTELDGDGNRVAYFTRSLAPPDEIEIAASGDDWGYFLYAYGDGDLSYHGPDNRGVFKLDLSHACQEEEEDVLSSGQFACDDPYGTAVACLPETLNVDCSVQSDSLGLDADGDGDCESRVTINNLCSNRGRSFDKEAMTCVCQSGFYGACCETEGRQFCKNNGRFVDLGSNVCECACQNGWEGTFCDQQI